VMSRLRAIAADRDKAIQGAKSETPEIATQPQAKSA